MTISIWRPASHLVHAVYVSAMVILMSCAHSEPTTRGTVDESPLDMMTTLEMLRAGQITFGGGDGSSLENAVVITGAGEPRYGVSAEYLYVSRIHGERGAKWKVKSREYIPADGRSYEKATIVIFGATDDRVYWFDITDFYGTP